MALPANVTYGTVTGRFLIATADTPDDTDRDPQGIAAADLKITFSPDLGRAVARDPTATPPTFFALADVSATIAADGTLLGPDGQPGVRLVASTNPALEPTGWTWQVKMSGTGYPNIGFSFLLDGGQNLDLGTVLQVPSNPGATLGNWIQAVTDAQAARDAALAAAASVPSAAQLAATYSPLRDVATTATSSGALIAGKHNPVSAAAGPVTMTLPSTPTVGQELTVEREDSTTANTFTISGTIRGASGATISLVGQYEAISFQAKNDGSWWPTAGHKTKAWMDSAYTQVAEMPPTPQRHRQPGDTDWTAALTALFASGKNAAYLPPTDPSSPYTISAEVRIPTSGMQIRGDGAIIQATAAMTNMLNVRAATTPEAVSVRGLQLDANNLATRGFLAYGFKHLGLRDIEVRNTLGDGIVLGDPDNGAKSYEAMLNGIRVWRPSGAAVPTGSRGIWTQWATDCEISDVVIVGQDIGIQADNSLHQFSHVHAWGYTGGLPSICFLDTGGNSWDMVSVDSPTVAGMKLTGTRSRVSNLRAFLNGFPTDNTVVGILSTAASPSHTFMNVLFRAASSAVRFASDYSGDYGGNAFYGWRNDGNVVTPVVPTGIDYTQAFRVGGTGMNIYGPSTVQGGQFTVNNSAAQAAKFADTAGTTLAVNIRTDSSRRLELVNGAPLFGYAGAYTTNTLKLDPAVGAVQSGTSAGLGASTYSGSGVPTSTLGVVGDHFWRTDTPTTANQRLYIKTATSTWVGVL